MAGANHKIHVYQDSDGEFRVYPPVIVVDADGGSNQDDVTFVNNTGEDLVYVMGPNVLSNAIETGSAAKHGGKSATKKVHSTSKGDSRLFIYRVIMVQSGKKAKGNSDPVIIIEN